jgi:hypothetical protein
LFYWDSKFFYTSINEKMDKIIDFWKQWCNDTVTILIFIFLIKGNFYILN